MFRILLAILGGLLLFGGAQALCRPDRRVHERTVYMALFIVGALLLFTAIAFPQLVALCGVSAAARGVGIAAAVIAAIPAGIAWMMLMSSSLAKKPTGEEQYMLVPGAPVVGETPTPVLVSRVDAACAWLAGHPGCRAVLCGGRGLRTEACVMADLMRKRGIDPGRLLLEEKSATTDENLMNARAILSAAGCTAGEPVVLVTSGFHVWRCKRYAARHGYRNIRYIAAATPWSVRVAWCAREVLVICRYWLTHQ